MAKFPSNLTLTLFANLSTESNASLQEFEVATEIFGKQVPPLQSISLAIDSNWGNDYACLYRFRVHGEEAEVDEDEDPFGP